MFSVTTYLSRLSEYRFAPDSGFQILGLLLQLSLLSMALMPILVPSFLAAGSLEVTFLCALTALSDSWLGIQSFGKCSDGFFFRS